MAIDTSKANRIGAYRVGGVRIGWGGKVASSAITLDAENGSFLTSFQPATLSYGAAPSGINFVASVNTTKPANSTMTVTLPTHSEGDVIVLSFVHDYNSNTQFLTAVSEGYTELATLNILGLNHQGAVWYKKAGASEVNPTATYSASSQEMACLAASYSGVDTVTKIDVGPSVWNTEDPGDTDVDAPSVTTTLDGAMLINVATADENDTYTQPSGMTLVDNLVFRNMVVASAYQEIPTAGPTGAKTWVFSQNTDEITAVSFALRPKLPTAFIIDAENGSFTTTLQPATLIYNALNDYVIDAQSGSFLTSGQDADLLFNRVLSSGSGSYLTTFNDSTLVYNTVGQYTIVANNGAFNTTGSNVSLLHGRNLAANTGEFTYAGQDVNLLAGRKIQALSGNYATTGQDVSFLYNRVIISQSGDFITTGYNVSLLYSGQEVQTIGTVTAGFKQDIYTAIYKPNSITVSFKD